jgi:hypothetical protein
MCSWLYLSYKCTISLQWQGLTFSLFSGLREKTMKKACHGVIVLGLILFTMTGRAGGEERVTGAKAAGLGWSAVTASDNWSSANNPAGIAWLTGWSGGLFAGNFFLVKELSYEAVSLVWSGRPGGFGLVIGYYGFSACNEVFTGISYARKFGKRLGIGLQLNYQRIGFSEGYGSKGMVSAKIGLMVKPGDHWTIGMSVSNPVPVKLSDNPKELLPLLFRLGVGYTIHDKVWLTLEGEKDLLHPVTIRSGIEVKVFSILTGRIGMATGPFVFTAGTGLRLKQWQIDIATGYHMVLGFSPALSLTWHPGSNPTPEKRKKR